MDEPKTIIVADQGIIARDVRTRTVGFDTLTLAVARLAVALGTR